MTTIEYKDAEFEYDESAFRKWSFIKRMSKASTDLERNVIASEYLFSDSDAVADRLNDDASEIIGLIAAIIEKAGEPAKN